MARRWATLVGVAALACLRAMDARAAGETHVSYAQALVLARKAAPDVAVARGRELVAGADVRIAGVYPNPTLLFGTTTQAARLSAGASIPLIIFGQLGAAVDASRADLATVKVDSEVVWNEVRTAVGKAFVALWLAERTAVARADAAAITKRLENVVSGKVELGAAPQVDLLRAHSEALRADADAQESADLVDAAAAELARYIGIVDAGALRTQGDPDVPAEAPPYAALAQRVPSNPSVRREAADARAAEWRASRERALVRPSLLLDLGVDLFDPTIANVPNYRAQLGIDFPIFNQRRPQIEREQISADVARSRANAEQARAAAALFAAHRTFAAVSARKKALEEGVVPAADIAAAATEESYTLGRAPLVAVLDAQRSRIDARVSLLDARAARANAWIDVEHALGGTP